MTENICIRRAMLLPWLYGDPRKLQLFLFLLLNANEQGEALVSINEFASRVNIPKSTLHRILDELIERGELIDLSETKAGQKKTHVKLCHFDDYCVIDVPYTSENGTKTGRNEDSKEKAEREERKAKETERESFLPPAPLSFKEKDKEREKKEEREEREGSRVSIDTLCAKEKEEGPTFEDFWDTYNFKKDRLRAEKEWKRLSKADRRAAIEGIKAYRADCEANELHMAYPKKYLSNRRWEDEFGTTNVFQASGPKNNSRPNYYGQMYDGQYYYTSRETQRELERQHRLREAEEAMARLAAKNKPFTW